MADQSINHLIKINVFNAIAVYIAAAVIVVHYSLQLSLSEDPPR